MNEIVPLSAEARLRVERMFSEPDASFVVELLERECSRGVPGAGSWSAEQLDRLRFAVLKLSRGSLVELQEALDLANLDYRDLLMSAGFGQPEAHLHWFPDGSRERG